MAINVLFHGKLHHDSLITRIHMCIDSGARGEKPDASATGIAMEWRGMCMAAHPREIFVASPHGLYLEDLRVSLLKTGYD